MSLVLFACLVTPNKLRTLIFIKTVKLGLYTKPYTTEFG